MNNKPRGPAFKHTGILPLELEQHGGATLNRYLMSTRYQHELALMRQGRGPTVIPPYVLELALFHTHLTLQGHQDLVSARLALESALGANVLGGADTTTGGWATSQAIATNLRIITSTARRGLESIASMNPTTQLPAEMLSLLANHFPLWETVNGSKLKFSGSAMELLRAEGTQETFTKLYNTGITLALGETPQLNLLFAGIQAIRVSEEEDLLAYARSVARTLDEDNDDMDMTGAMSIKAYVDAGRSWALA